MGDAGKTIGDIVTQVRRVTELVVTISAATNEQGAGIGHINDTVTELDRSTQQNSALVQHSAAAADALQQQAARLVEAVRAFKLDDKDSAQHVAAVA